jgi:hypothetical protein
MVNLYVYPGVISIHSRVHNTGDYIGARVSTRAFIYPKANLPNNTAIGCEVLRPENFIYSHFLRKRRV